MYKRFSSKTSFFEKLSYAERPHQLETSFVRLSNATKSNTALLLHHLLTVSFSYR